MESRAARLDEKALLVLALREEESTRNHHPIIIIGQAKMPPCKKE
jgi:hypothetical protein